MTHATKRAPRMSRVDLVNKVDTLPRVPIAYLPTPLDDAPRLRQAIGPNSPRILIKRDDLTGLAFGGNKVRHLEFRLGDLRQKNADTLIVTNVAQSNHARLHTALAAKFGLTNYIIKIPSHKDDPINGNLLLDHVMGARIVDAASADPAVVDKALSDLVAQLESEGHVVYNVPRDPFSKIAGTCAYLAAAVELLDQLAARDLSVDHIFLASGTSSAGLALAGKVLGETYRVHAVSVGGSHNVVLQSILACANAAADLLGLDERLTRDDITIHDNYFGERYGVPTPAGLDSISLAGQTEGLILDPVYTGKALSGLVDQCRNGVIGVDETVVFIHTGGQPITFAYSEEILSGVRQGGGA